jgi:hypothetical protein
MIKSNYDTNCSTWNPQGKLFQVNNKISFKIRILIKTILFDQS